MIKLFITDLDGCLSTPFKTPDWDLLAKIRELNELSESDKTVAPLSICSGRPMPYVEAIAQWLNIRVPVAFENAGILKVASNEISVSPVFDEGAKEQVLALKNWLRTEIIPRHPGMELEFTKLMDAGFIHLDQDVVNSVHTEVEEYIEKYYPLFEAHKTDVSVNIILKNNNKKKGIRMICDNLGLEPSEVAYIGDSSGDIPGLKLVGHPFAPSNAVEDVKKVAEVLDYQTTRAVLEAYRLVIAKNKQKFEEEETS